MTHIYECYKLNNEKKLTQSYERIYNGELIEQVQIFKLMKQNMQKRNQIVKNLGKKI